MRKRRKELGAEGLLTTMGKDATHGAFNNAAEMMTSSREQAYLSVHTCCA